MPSPFITRRRVEFSDTDMAGITHFAAYFRYLETAEHELLRSLGLSVHTADRQEHISWPRVSAQCDFQGPARFEDELEIEVRVLKLGEKSVTYGFVVRNEEKQIATGSMTSVCCRIAPGQPPKSIPIPAVIRSRLETAVESSS